MLDALISWDTLRVLMWILYVPSCLGLIGVVLLQKGKGAGFAGAFGIGPGSDAVFGPRVSRSLPVRLTYVMATIFIVLALGLSIVEGKAAKGRAPAPVTEETPAAVDVNLEDLGLGAIYEKDEEPEVVPPVSEQDQSSESSTAPETPGAAPHAIEGIPSPDTAPDTDEPASDEP